MSRKKNERHDDKLQQIYDEEPVIPVLFNKRTSDPKAFLKDGVWYCGRLGCVNDNVSLWRMGGNRFLCGHCYHKYVLREIKNEGVL